MLFAAARDLAGADSVVVELPTGSTVAELAPQTRPPHSALAGLLAKSAIAVNHDFAEDDGSFQPTDEVAVIPPVSGG